MVGTTTTDPRGGRFPPEPQRGAMVTLANEAAVSQASTSACCSPSAGGRSARTAGVPSKSAGKNSPIPELVRGWRRRAADSDERRVRRAAHRRAGRWPLVALELVGDVARQVRRAQLEHRRVRGLGRCVSGEIAPPGRFRRSLGLVFRLTVAVGADIRARRVATVVVRADVDHLAHGEAGHDHRRGTGQHGRGVAPSPAGGQVDDRSDAGGAGLVTGQTGEHGVEPIGDVGRDRHVVPGLGEQPAYLRLLLGGELGQRAGIMLVAHGRYASSRGFRSVWLGRDQPGSGGARDASVVRTDGNGVGVPRGHVVWLTTGPEDAEQGGQPGPAARAAGLHGADGTVEHRGHLGDRIALHVDQDQRGLLVGGQLVEGGQHRPAPLLDDREVGRVGGLGRRRDQRAAVAECRRGPRAAARPGAPWRPGAGRGTR